MKGVSNMFKPFNLGNDFKKTVKTFFLGLVLGIIITGLWLDKRYLALYTAFQFPQAVNSSEFKAEVAQK